MPDLSDPTPLRLPRWRGFNLIEKFQATQQKSEFRESDFDLIAGWGFNFVRLPMDYRCWAKPESPRRIDADVFKEIDQAIEFGFQRKIHINLNLHRVPGYCVNSPKEPRDLWTDDQALADAAYTWGYIAKRYKGMSNHALSFNLLNEPPDLAPAVYRRVVERLVQSIRAEDPDRLIIADGLKHGRAPVPELQDLGIAQSTRGYSPMQISHYLAHWIKNTQWPTPPTWPLIYKKDGREITCDRADLNAEYDAWRALSRSGVGVHVGEFGAHNQTPHDVALKWMADLLAIWKAEGWGWALWNFRGTFGVLDSHRAGVKYETLGQHQLDRELLELLRSG